MSKEDPYFTLPLAILRSGRSGLEVLEDCVCSGIVNAGVGYREVHGESGFNEVLQKAKVGGAARNEHLTPPKPLEVFDADGNLIPESKARGLWFAALVGSELLGFTGGDRVDIIRRWARHHRPRQVFFRIRSDWMNGALLTARREAGQEIGFDFRPLSWREFRILAGILSAKVNTYDFTFCGWELIQATACGFHSKKLLSEGKAALPAHCQPLTRYMIRDGTGRLEALGFFARCQYSRGRTGGLMAYSFRHPRRDDLLAAVGRWDDSNRFFKTKTTGLRASDVATFRKTRPPPSLRQLAAKPSTTLPPGPAPSRPPT